MTPRLLEIFRFLREAKCPLCGDPNAYVGLHKVECPSCGGDPKTVKSMKDPQPGQYGHHGYGRPPGVSGPQSSGQGLPQVWYNTPNRQKRYDQFSKNLPEFKKNISDVLDRLLGKNWKGDIEKAYGPGSVDRMFKGLWDGNWSDYEGVEEFGFAYDVAQKGDVAHYPHVTDPGVKYTGGYERGWRAMDPNDF